MTAIKNIYQLENAVKDYMSRHGLEEKHSRLNIVNNTYNVDTMNYNRLESKIILMKNEKTKVIFKVNGKITSIYK